MRKVITGLIFGMLLLSVVGFVAADNAYGMNASVKGSSFDRNTDVSARAASIKAEVDAAKTAIENFKAQREALKDNLTALKGQIRDLREYAKTHGGWINVSGKNVTVRDLGDNEKEILVDKINAKTGLNLTVDDLGNGTLLRAYLSNGRWANIKYMPNTASARALENMKAKCESRNCTVQLKEVGVGDQKKVVYEVSTDKDSKLFGIFGSKMKVTAQVDAETGQVISVKKPWWSFLASEDNSVNANETAAATQ